MEDGSFWSAIGVRHGDVVSAINDTEIRDIIDVYFASSDGIESVEVIRDGESVVIDAGGGEEDSYTGIEFEELKYARCPNKCIFCFIDQLPKGLRDSLYFKDEDYRLSFLFGNYLTLTNLSDEDLERIREQRLSPLYASVHTTDDDLRRKMLGNPKATEIMPMLERLASFGVQVHCQVVVCPGINDGAVLEKTIRDLAASYPSVASVAVVPVGLSSHREGLEEISPVDKKVAGEVVQLVSGLQDAMLERLGSRFAFLADEFYMMLKRDMPEQDDYEDFSQVEDGVGMLRQFLTEVEESSDISSDRPGVVGILTGKLAEPAIKNLVVQSLEQSFPNATFRILAAVNTLFGPTVTVTGLLSGADMIRSAKRCDDCDCFVLPPNSFNSDGVTLDDMSAEDISRALGKAVLVPSGNLFDALREHMESH